ncbi:Warthog protein 8 [Toxocara canis]|uniref:Warthog protein 8 n=1 Tax=Toxocara canis TaxID=6265 RepID=A0A0B2VQI8_TOXCA|nr:Warthog protein 8 [Toxocara canis]
MKWVVAFLLPPLISTLSYRCDNDQVLIVQSFGNDSIRMHCQRLNLCGFERLKCVYDPLQPQCGGKTNFVAHVSQLTPSGPVTHTCCNLEISAGKLVREHDGNDCFVYELPDGTKRSTGVKSDVEDESEYTLLKDANKIPEQFANYTGYRLRLFLLKNKSPPTLIVKGIERRPSGYRVTICRPRCGKLSDSDDIGRKHMSPMESSNSSHEPVVHENDKVTVYEVGRDENIPAKSTPNDTDSGTAQEGSQLIQLPKAGEWIIATWSAWATSSSHEPVVHENDKVTVYEVGRDENIPAKSTPNDTDSGTAQEGSQLIQLPKAGEWIIATWSAWATSRWTSWTHREWSEYGDISGDVRTRGERYRVSETDNTSDRSSTGLSRNSSGQESATSGKSVTGLNGRGEAGSPEKDSKKYSPMNTVNIIVDRDQHPQSETSEPSGQKIDGQDRSVGLQPGERGAIGSEIGKDGGEEGSEHDGQSKGDEDSNSFGGGAGKFNMGVDTRRQSGKDNNKPNDRGRERNSTPSQRSGLKQTSKEGSKGDEADAGSSSGGGRDEEDSSSADSKTKKENENDKKKGQQPVGGDNHASESKKPHSETNEEARRKKDGDVREGSVTSEADSSLKVSDNATEPNKNEKEVVNNWKENGKQSETSSEIPENEEEDEIFNGEVRPGDLEKQGGAKGDNENGSPGEGRGKEGGKGSLGVKNKGREGEGGAKTGEKNTRNNGSTSDSSGGSAEVNRAEGEGQRTEGEKSAEDSKRTRDDKTEGQGIEERDGSGDRSKEVDGRAAPVRKQQASDERDSHEATMSTLAIPKVLIAGTTSQGGGESDIIDKEDGFKIITMKPRMDTHLSEIDKMKEEMSKLLIPTPAPRVSEDLTSTRPDNSRTTAGALGADGGAKVGSSETHATDGDGQSKGEGNGKTPIIGEEVKAGEKNGASAAKEAAARLIAGEGNPAGFGESMLAELGASGGGASAPGTAIAAGGSNATAGGGGAAAAGARAAGGGSGAAVRAAGIPTFAASSTGGGAARAQGGLARRNCFSADTTVHTIFPNIQLTVTAARLIAGEGNPAGFGESMLAELGASGGGASAPGTAIAAGGSNATAGGGGAAAAGARAAGAAARLIAGEGNPAGFGESMLAELGASGGGASAPGTAIAAGGSNATAGGGGAAAAGARAAGGGSGAAVRAAGIPTFAASSTGGGAARAQGGLARRNCFSADTTVHTIFPNIQLTVTAARLIAGEGNPAGFGESMLAELGASGGGASAPGTAIAAGGSNATAGGGGAAAAGARAAGGGSGAAVRAAGIPTFAASSTGGGAARAQGGLARRNCFSADTTVHTQSGLKTMKELEVGDYVLVPASGNVLKYERVEMFYHREPETRAKFVVIETESGRSLSLTELHLIPLGQCKEMRSDIMDMENIDEWMRKSRFAHKARPGDCVLSIGDEGRLQVDRIVKVGRRFLKGIYSPMTVEGSIVTSGVLASCFSQVESHFVQKLVYDILTLLYRGFGRTMVSLNDPVQHLPSFVEFVHQMSQYMVPFAKY